MPRPSFWVFSLVGFFFFFCLSSLDWMNFLGIFWLLCFSQFKSFWCTLYTSFLPRWTCTFLCLMNLSFLMKSLLDKSYIPLGMMNFRFFKLDAHFSFSHIDRISWSLIFTHLSCLLRELYQLASNLQGWVLLNTRFKYA